MSSLERELLRRLCSCGNFELLPKQAFEELGRYSWQERDHQVIFEALMRVNARGRGGITQEQLAAETTRMGFPDIDLREIFSSGTPEQAVPSSTESEPSLSALIQQVNSAAQE